MKGTSLATVAKLAGFLAVGTLVSVVLVSKADARTIGAFAGLPLDGDNIIPCFAESGGAVTGTGAHACAGVPYVDDPRWEVQLPVDNYGVKHVTVGIKGNGQSGPTCAVWTFDQTSNYLGTSSVMTNNTAYFQIETADSAPIPTNGYMFLACGYLTASNVAVGSITWAE
jgi:hypothetical protein